MRGSVVKRGAGYSVVVELDRDPVTGKRRQKWHSGYPQTGHALQLQPQHPVARRARLGSVLLRRVDGGMLNALYAELLASGKLSNGGGGLARGPFATCTRSCIARSKTRCAGDGWPVTRPTRRTRPGQAPMADRP